MDITPEFIFDFESNLQALVVDEWQRVTPNLVWDGFMKLRTSSTSKELLEWMLTTAQIHPEGDGGNKRFDDIVSISHEIKNEDFGAALVLKRNHIEDNQIDRAGQWARHIGSAGAYWPQQQMFELINNGKTNLAYDGKPFFATDHPVNPHNTGLSDYANLLYSKPIDSSVTLEVAAKNLADVVAYIMGLKMPNGKPRMLRPTKLLSGPALKKRMMELTGAQAFGQGGTNTTAAADNVLRQYGFEPPTIAHEITDATTWYIGAEDLQSDELGGLIFQERKAFELSSYQGESEAALNRRDEFEWHFKGRNVATYGHPYLLFRCEAGAAP